MPYTVELQEWTSTEVFTTKTDGSVRFKNANNAVVDTDDAIVKPTTAGGEDWSFEKYLRLRITADTTSGSTSSVIQDFTFHTDGTNSFGTGAAMFVRTTTAFAAPSQPSSTTGWTNAFTFNSTNQLALSSTGETFSTVGHVGRFLVCAFRGTTGIAAGLTPTETGTFTYFETT